MEKEGFGIKQRSISPSETGDFEFFRFNMIFFHQKLWCFTDKKPNDTTGYNWI